MKFKTIELEKIVTIRNENIKDNRDPSLIYVSTANMVSNKGGLDYSDLENIGKDGKKFKKDDVLVSNIRPYFKKIWKAKCDGLCSNDVLRFIPKNEKMLDKEFLYYMLSNSSFFDYMTATAKGTKMPRGDINAIKKYQVPNVYIKEQKKIADFLSSFDTKIENNNAIISNLEDLAQAIFKSWFIDFEPFQGGNFVDSELGEIPEGWEVKKISEVTDSLLGGTPAKKNGEYWNGDIPWINSGEINKLRIIEPTEYITNEGLENSSTKMLPKKTTVIAITGATLGQVSLLEIDSCANQSVIGVLENEDLPYEFIYPFFLSNIDRIILNKTGSSQQHINNGDIKNTKILIPIKEVMNSYKRVAFPIYKLVENYTIQNKVLAQVRDTLLPKLMSGELRISQDDVEDIGSQL